jgi:hypothetical protein
MALAEFDALSKPGERKSLVSVHRIALNHNESRRRLGQ